jgi:hypothetical protein
MSKLHLREEKNCLNCGNTVSQRFCGNCGQENIEPRQTFGHLVAHFFEDLTHYEGKFWGTLRYLFFKPAYLTKEFLAGKRSKYLPPVRLYIFASFITFFLPGIIPDAPSPSEHDKSLFTYSNGSFTFGDQEDDSTAHRNDSTREIAREGLFTALADKDSILRRSLSSDSSKTPDENNDFFDEFETKHELDSAKLARSTTDDPMGFLAYTFHKKVLDIKRIGDKYPKDIQVELFKEAFAHNFPRALFLYMPLFALILRLFHKKKNWIYFDHGILTLHFFSFMLLTFLCMNIVSDIDDWVDYAFPSLPLGWIFKLIEMAMVIWSLYYFFKAHRDLYGESRAVSALKAWMIFFINSIVFMLVFIGVLLVAILSVH